MADHLHQFIASKVEIAHLLARIPVSYRTDESAKIMA